MNTNINVWLIQFIQYWNNRVQIYSNYKTMSTLYVRKRHLAEFAYSKCHQIQLYKYTSGQHQKCKKSKDKTAIIWSL